MRVGTITEMATINLGAIGRYLAVAAPALAAATVVVGALETYLAIPNASVVYLTAVVAAAMASGTVGAILTALEAFVVYDFFFTEPYHTFTIRDPSEWLSLILLLFVGIVVGQLAAMQRARAQVAEAREREARALFRVSRDLATRPNTAAVLPVVVRALRADTSMARVWVSLGEDDARERVAADSETGSRPAVPAACCVLRRTPGDDPAQWVRVHQPGVGPGRKEAREAYRVRIEAGTETFGSIWAIRERSRGWPDHTETRLLGAAADQIGQVLAHDRLAAEMQAAEVARESDALKSALLQSVSHDLRTPLATIRAAAGTLRPGSSLSERGRQESADAIDREVEYLDRLVTNLLDLSRIEAGALRAERDVFELDDVAGVTLDRLRPRLGGRSLDVDLAAPLVRVDPVFLDDALTNVVENAIKYTPADARIRITARELRDEPFIRLTVEDSGEGVPPEALGRLFDKFYRVPGRHRDSRSGMGIGLAVVRGLIQATGGRVGARISEDLGGLAIDLDLRAAPEPAPIATETAR
jgi:two-component system sensor histidine kinase KdpD